jgi:DnaJ family protein C protein 3
LLTWGSFVLRLNCTSRTLTDNACSRLTSLLPEAQTPAVHALVFRLSFFLLPASPVASNAVKQCLHSDPESRLCLPLHRLAKTLERGFTMAEEQGAAGDWRGALATLKGTGKKGDIFRKFEEAAAEQLRPEHLTLFGLDKGKVVLPAVEKVSHRRRTLLRGLCKGHTMLEMYRKGEEWCQKLYDMEGGEEDADALRGLGEAAVVKEEWEEGVRLLEKAFEATGRSDRDVGAFSSLPIPRR